MMTHPSTKSNNVKKRMEQRAISDSMIECVLDFGEVFHRQGCFMYFLADRNLVKGCDASTVEASRGLVVITSADGVVITAYRNRKSGLKDLKKKDKINRKKDRAVRQRAFISNNTFAHAA